MGVSGKLETAIGMGPATTFVMTLASACSYLMEHYILIRWTSPTCTWASFW
jgi:electron transport complex protein RnfA